MLILGEAKLAAGVEGFRWQLPSGYFCVIRQAKGVNAEQHVAFVSRLQPNGS